MNFDAVRQANGQNVQLNAIATVIDGTSYTTTGTPKQQCAFTDANGETQKVTIWQGKGIPIPPERQGLTLSINISAKVKGNYTNYGGFWNSTAETRPLTPPQAPPQPSGQPDVPARNQYAEPMVKPQQTEDMARIRSMAWAYGKDLEGQRISTGGVTPIEDSLDRIYRHACAATAFILHGVKPEGTLPYSDEPPQDDQNMPF